MSEIDESCDISVIIFFNFWRSSSNAKSITPFYKKHFTQLIKLIDIFNLINILISCFNVTWSKASLTFRSKQISVFSRLFVICASCTRFSKKILLVKKKIQMRANIKHIIKIDSDLLKHIIYQINRQVIEQNCMIKTSSHSTQ